MVSRDFQALAAARAARAHLLAGRYPASREALLFFAEIASLQAQLAASLPSNPAAGRGFALEMLLPGRQQLVELVAEKGPEMLREQARRFDEPACRESLRAYFTHQDTISPHSFFARVLLQPAMFAWRGPAACEPSPPGQIADARRRFENTPQLRQATELSAGASLFPLVTRRPAASCPRCGHAPQAGCLRPQGDGMALTLLCSLCLREWPFPRLHCPACSESDHRKIHFYSSPEFAHLQTQVCESCQAFLHLVDLAKEPQAIPDVDELAALPLDLWALEQGYCKVQPNLAGI